MSRVIDYKKILECVLIDETGCDMCTQVERLKDGRRDCKLGFENCIKDNNRTKFEIDEQKLNEEYQI